jgi:mannose-6-phosphate isomerase-like protein (cupin superfamily)
METVSVGPIRVGYVLDDPGAGYALLEWEAPAGAASPPIHVHHRTDEGFYVLTGTFRFMVDGATTDAVSGSHVLVRKGLAHTFWNVGSEPARCLIVLTPPDFASYFRALAKGLSTAPSDEEAMRVRKALSGRYDIEVVGPPITPGQPEVFQ